MEIRTHLVRMLPEAGYRESRVGREYTRATERFLESIVITDSGRVVVLVQRPSDVHRWEQIAAVRLEDVIVCKGYTLIGSHAIDH